MEVAAGQHLDHAVVHPVGASVTLAMRAVARTVGVGPHADIAARIAGFAVHAGGRRAAGGDAFQDADLVRPQAPP
jgi:hypothetical protein